MQLVTAWTLGANKFRCMMDKVEEILKLKETLETLRYGKPYYRLNKNGSLRKPRAPHILPQEENLRNYILTPKTLQFQQDIRTITNSTYLLGNGIAIYLSDLPTHLRNTNDLVMHGILYWTGVLNRKSQVKEIEITNNQITLMFEEE